MGEWQSVTLGDVIQLEYGKPLPPEDRIPNGRYPVYGANGEKDRTDKYYRDQPSIIVGRKGSAGEVTLTEEKYWPLDVTYFAVFDRNKYELRFLYYLLIALDLPRFAKGVKPGINRNEVYSIPVRVPGIAEQQRIVAILDDAFEGIATAKAHAEMNLRNARTVLAQRVDDWCRSLAGAGHPLCPLGELATFRNGINFTKNSKGDRVQIIGVKDFQQNFDAPMGDLEWVTLDGSVVESDCLADGDIVFVRSNGNPELIGRCMLVGEVVAPTVHSGFTIKMRLHDQRLDSRFLCHYLKSTAIRKELVDGGNGANIKSLNQGTLAAVRVPVPSKDQQGRLVDQFEALEQQVAGLTSVYQRKLTALEELKQALLHQAFTGQL